jgi:hypothetical protein
MDQEKVDANTGMVTVSPPNNNEVIAIGSEDEEEMEIILNYTRPQKKIGPTPRMQKPLQGMALALTTSLERSTKNQD